MQLYTGTDGTIYALGLRDPVTGIYVDNATSFTGVILNPDGSSAASLTFASIGANTPITINGQTWPAGNYQASLPSSSGLIPGARYQFQAVAVNAAGSQTTFQGEVTAGPVPLTN